MEATCLPPLHKVPTSTQDALVRSGDDPHNDAVLPVCVDSFQLQGTRSYSIRV